MKAVHLLYSIKPGGAENVALNYSKALRLLGVESVIIGRKDDLNYERNISKDAIVSYDLDKSLLQSQNVIFIHCNQWLPKLLKYITTLKKKKIRVCYIQHLNYNAGKFLALSALINLICTDFIQITPITTKLVQRYIFRKCHFLVNFYIQRYQKQLWSEIRKKIRKEVEIPESKRIVCFSAIFKPGKRVGDFLELADKCYENKKYHFLLIGDGPENYLVKNYHKDNLTWIGRVTDVEKYLIASDIYYFPSKFEQEMMPMALIEAINTDKLIIAYPTAINNFLLDSRTYEYITDSSILSQNLPNGVELKHYDLEYGASSLKTLLKLNKKGGSIDS